MSVREAKQAVKLRQELIKRFRAIKERNRGTYEKHKEDDQPIIDAIQDLGKDIKEVSDENKNLIMELNKIYSVLI